MLEKGLAILNLEGEQPPAPITIQGKMGVAFAGWLPDGKPIIVTSWVGPRVE